MRVSCRLLCAVYQPPRLPWCFTSPSLCATAWASATGPDAPCRDVPSPTSCPSCTATNRSCPNQPTHLPSILAAALVACGCPRPHHCLSPACIFIPPSAARLSTERAIATALLCLDRPHPECLIPCILAPILSPFWLPCRCLPSCSRSPADLVKSSPAVLYSVPSTAAIFPAAAHVMLASPTDDHIRASISVTEWKESVDVGCRTRTVQGAQTQVASGWCGVKFDTAPNQDGRLWKVAGATVCVQAGPGLRHTGQARREL